jgi:hypothetical protein
VLCIAGLILPGMRLAELRNRRAHAVELRRLNGFSLPLTVPRGIPGDQVVPSIASRTISESSSGV